MGAKKSRVVPAKTPNTPFRGKPGWGVEPAASARMRGARVAALEKAEKAAAELRKRGL